MQPRSWVLAVVGAALLLSSLAVLTADASSSVVASFGTRGAAKVTSGGPNTVYVNLKNLPDGTWGEVLYKGTCATLGARILTLPTLTVMAGVVRRTNTLSVSQAGSAGKGVIRIAMGTTTYCAPFRAAVATPTATPSRSPRPSGPGRTPGPTPTPTATPTSSATGAPTPTGTSTAAPTGTSSPSSGACTSDGSTYGCVGDTFVVFFADGREGRMTVEAATRSASSVVGFVTEDVRIKVTGPAGEDVTFDWQVGDIGGQATLYNPQPGAPSPAYPTYTSASGVAVGWLRFVIPTGYRPYITSPGGAPIRL